jgi:hypothetical protein
MTSSSAAPNPTDLLSVKSRVSWGAIAAGAMVALAVYFVLAMLGVALSIEVASRGSSPQFGAGAAIYSILTLLVAMFFGGWATSRLAVGETKLEAVLYGVILWGVLFTGLIWMVSAGVRVGFGAVVGAASGVYSSQEGDIDMDRIAADLKKAGVDQAQVDRYRAYAEKLQADPTSVGDVGRDVANRPEVRRAARDVGEGARRASWWTIAGIAVSMLSVIFGSLIGSGEVPVPIPVLGVRRPARDPRV